MRRIPLSLLTYPLANRMLTLQSGIEKQREVRDDPANGTHLPFHQSI